MSNGGRGVRQTLSTAAVGTLCAGLAGCAGTPDAPATTDVERGLDQYATVALTTDMSALTEQERAMLPLLIDAGSRYVVTMRHPDSEFTKCIEKIYNAIK